MTKVSDVINKQISLAIENFNSAQLEYNTIFQNTVEDLEYILHCVKTKEIKITSKRQGDVKSNSAHSIDTFDDVSRPSQKNKRGRPKRLQEANLVDNSDESSSSDIPPSRSQRAAAQAAGHKLAQVQIFMKTTKLRRPSDFEERQSSRNKRSSPPSKSRKTHRKQSAGSSPFQNTNETNGSDNILTESEVSVNDGGKEEIELIDACLTQECTVQLEHLTKSVIKTYGSALDERSRDSQDSDEIKSPAKNEVKVCTGSEEIIVIDDEINNSELKDTGLKNGCSVQLEQLTNSAMKNQLLKRKSSDIFDDSISLEDFVNNKTSKLCSGAKNEINHVLTNKESNKSGHKRNNKKAMNEKLINSDEDQYRLKDATSGSRSPLSEGEFRGFDVKECNIILKDVHSDSEVMNVQINEVKQRVMRKTTFTSNKKENVTKMEQVDVITTKTKTELLKKKTIQDTTKATDSNEQINNSRSSSKENICEAIENVTEEDLKSVPKSYGVKNDKKEPFVKTSDSENESPEVKLRSRTKVIKKNTEVDVVNEGTRTRTKTLRKAPEGYNEKTGTINTLELAANEQNKKLVSEVCVSPAQNKGELVKKRVEDFERMKSDVENTKEETTRRVTRQNRNKTTETQTARVNRTAKLVPMSSERPRLTPLGTQNNRVTPAVQSRVLVVNKGISSATRQTPNEHNIALVQKQIIEEAERKKKEDEILKRQAKEETAKKKKEKTLKATAEETRRKREERLQKAVAAREAAEKEKQLLALKAEKEKEEKMQQIAAEKEKQREEQFKKKQLAQQKALEHEERRKQEEAARLAKLREQEEEHKRVVAMKERELELQKQQKAAELRLVENEKAKCLQHGGKLGKLAAVNSANMKLQQGVTSAVPPNESYAITPAREDRPLVEPKSENDYGIDDANSEDSSDEESKPKKKIPLWAQPKNRYKLMVINDSLPKAIWPLFMECNANPDVNELFAGNKIKKRTRTSSAVWNTPPGGPLFKNN